jgi:hypothetical protein
MLQPAALCSNKQLPDSTPTSDASAARPAATSGLVLFFSAIFFVLLAARLCHIDILWADEDYHQAAALQVLHGKALYRDLWYDKPPLNVAAYLLFGAAGGAVLRLASALYALSICATAFVFARWLWSDREGRIAACVAAFFLIFYFPAATITLEPDTLLILPHLWAVYFAWRKRFFAAGFVAGIAMLLNVKALFVLATCAVLGFGLEWASLAWLAIGFAIPNLLGLVWLGWLGAFAGYVEQVWRWGFLYAGSTTAIGTALAGGLGRAGNWAAFHAALVLAAAWCWWKEPERRAQWIAWTALSFAGAAVGWRFLPRYLDQLLPPLIMAASRGIALIVSEKPIFEKSRALQIVLALALLVPAVRFGPRYAMLAAEDLRGSPHAWTDTAMDRDSRAAARIISGMAETNATLFVWGYRPNLFVYTGLKSASRFWDSQPLTGVPADRHLSSEPPAADGSAGRWATENRAELMRSRPDFIADGLSLYNPRLDLHRYADLAPWLAAYCEVARTSGTIIYRRCDKDTPRR